AAQNQDIRHPDAGLPAPLRGVVRGIVVPDTIEQTSFRSAAIHHGHFVPKPGEPLGDVIQRKLASSKLPHVNAGGRKWLMRAGKKPNTHFPVLSGMIA